MVAYDENSIVSREGLQIIRGNMTQFLDDLETKGQVQMANEGFDNCLDEIALLGDKGFFNITLCRDPSRQTYQIIIRDNGRGIPLGINTAGQYTLVNSMTKPNTSGKFTTVFYKNSAGLFGLGAKVVMGGSVKARVISHRPEGSGSLTVRSGEHLMVPELDMTPNSETGVTIVYEPDPLFFTGISSFSEIGYLGIVNRLKSYVFFRHYNISFLVLDQTVFDDAFYDLPIAEADQRVRQAEQQARVLWTSNDHDRGEWIRTVWQLHRPFTWSCQYEKPIKEDVGLQDYIIQLYYVRGEKSGDNFSLVNNVPIRTPDSDNLSVITHEVKAHLSAHIQADLVRKFFLEDYQMPLFIASDIKYEGAKFTGTTKFGFKQVRFRELFRAEIQDWFRSLDGSGIISTLYGYLAEDIQSRYQESLGSKITLKDQGRLYTQLWRPRKYKPCNAKDRSNTELFLVEGDSAGGFLHYDTTNQAIYKLEGKSLNVISSWGESRLVLIKRFLTNKIYEDICTIINYDLYKPDLSTLNFKSCILGVDGD